jgi:sialate O-acetylesterase
MKRLLLSAFSLIPVLTAPAAADVKLPTVLGSHMVLQRDKPIPIWGWADPGEEVTVEFAGMVGQAKADDAGKWKVTLGAQKANATGHKLRVKGKNSLELDDVLVGEVWVGSGQSNMEWSVSASANPKETIAAAKHPNIRLFNVQKIQAAVPLPDVGYTFGKISWRECTPASVPQFSAVLYHFGVRLQKDLDVPIGLINSSWGGSPIEPWTVTGKSSGTMYNAMIAPLMPFAIRGVIWYQGESNVGNGLAYRDKTEALVKGWRAVWGEDMPFYFVQIAPWSGYGAGSLPRLWEGQVASLKIPHTGMAVVTDLVDNIKDIHPKNKLDVGNRLALWALAKTYGKKDLVYSGPLYKSMKVEGNKVRLSFTHTGGGLASRDGKPLTEFEIAGEDGKFVPGEAVIEGQDVVVSAAGVDNPTQVRFGWRNTANPNLMNKEGLPASPFQTTDWHGGTGE